jgi:hypothetical protein
MALSRLAKLVIQTAVGLGVAFLVTLLVLRLFAAARWSDNTILVVMTTFAAISFAVFWVVDKFGGDRRLPPPTYRPPEEPPAYIR